MQNSLSKKTSNSLLQNIAIGLVLLIVLALFALVIGRMGLLSFGGAATVGKPGEIRLSSADMTFGQDELRVPAGKQVTLQLTNDDLFAHSFDVDALDLHLMMPAKEQVTATFTPELPGTYTFYCALPGHEEAGMVGTLIVTE